MREKIEIMFLKVLAAFLTVIASVSMIVMIVELIKNPSGITM